MFYAHRFAALVCAYLCGAAIGQTNFSYNARIQCGNSSVTNNEYFSARNDMEAKNEVMRLLNNSTGYRGKACRLVELTSDAPQKRTTSNSYPFLWRFSPSAGLLGHSVPRPFLNAASLVELPKSCNKPADWKAEK